MKIAFLCACAEPGRDGVGDYTRRLAEACVSFGHECLVLALHDRSMNFPITDRSGEHLTVQRWPSAMPWDQRSGNVAHAVRAFGADCLSWQFVSYGFDPKGIVGPELTDLAEELSDMRSHVTLHEIWIGVAQGDSPWRRLVGWRQARSILRFLQALRPVHLQTSTPSYAAVLGSHGWNASVLPVFSNIPVHTTEPPERAALLQRLIPENGAANSRLVGLTFGTLHPEWDPTDTALWLQTVAAGRERTPVLLAMGRLGAHGPAILERVAATGLRTVVTGELSPREASGLLQAADFGIATHPWALLGKSGAVSAMLAHGLPVLAPRDDWRLRKGPALPAVHDPRVIRLRELNPDNTEPWLRRRHSPGDSFPTIVSRFLKDLAA